MKKITSIFLTAIIATAITSSAPAKTKYNYVTPKAPVVTESLKPCIAKYKAGNYTGAMLDLEALLEKEKNNTYAKYYLALCYTVLGYDTEAKETYQKVIEKNDNETLTYYSKKALACIENPASEACVPKAKANPVDKKQEEEQDDITKFIYSGKKIHPAAMDLIIKQRMDIKLQQDEFQNKQNEQLGPLSSAPTNEEIAQALNTLSKIGINPFSENYMLSNTSDYGYMNYGNYYGNLNSDIEQRFLYGQLNQQKNNFINYGI